MARAAPAQPRIGWLGDWGGAFPMEPGILALAEAALARMEGAGWAVEPVAPPVSRELLWDAGPTCAPLPWRRTLWNTGATRRSGRN
jgi:Asp-tRNA(Asn)/Glu-tRNA(Gln) amidotransferase A subunit family amidase